MTSVRLRKLGRSRVVASTLVLNTVDQALYSLSNAGLTVVVAKTSSAEEFGDFALAATFFMLAIALTRAVVNQPYMMRRDRTEVSSVDPRSAVGSALLVGGVGFVAASCLLAFSPAPGLVPVIVVGFALPALVAQDALRTVFVVNGTAGRAVLNDVIWALVQFGLAFWIIWSGLASPVSFTVSWALGGVVAAILGMYSARLLPALRASVRYLRENADISLFMVLEAAVIMGASQAVLILIGVLASPSDLGAIRGAQTLLGPLNILGFGVIGALVPELVRRSSAGWRGHARLAAVVASSLTAINVAWGAALLLLPEPIGVAILGDTWDGARAVVLPLTIFFASVAAGNPALAVIRSLGQVRRSFKIYLVLAPLVIVVPLIGLRYGMAAGAAWGMAGASVAVLPLWWDQMRRALRADSQAAS